MNYFQRHRPGSGQQTGGLNLGGTGIVSPNQWAAGDVPFGYYVTSTSRMGNYGWNAMLNAYGNDFVIAGNGQDRPDRMQYNTFSKLAWLDGSSGESVASVTSFSGFQGIHSLPGLGGFANINANRGKKNLGVGTSGGSVYGGEVAWTGIGTVGGIDTWNTTGVDGYYGNGRTIGEGTGLNSYVNVLNATNWTTMNVSTIGGATAEAVSQSADPDERNNTGAWFGGGYYGDLLNVSDRPYGARGHLGQGVLFSSASLTNATFLTRPLL